MDILWVVDGHTFQLSLHSKASQLYMYNLGKAKRCHPAWCCPDLCLHSCLFPTAKAAAASSLHFNHTPTAVTTPSSGSAQ
jgi:hypothetical protein